MLTEYPRKRSYPFKGRCAVKILLALVLLAMVLSCRGFMFPAATAGLAFLLCITIRVPLRIFVLRFSEPLFIAAIVLVLKLFSSGHDALFSLNIFGLHLVGHRDGLLEGLIICNRIIGAVSIVALLGFSTPFTEIMAGPFLAQGPEGFHRDSNVRLPIYLHAF